jgi:hypothetical protein
MWHIIIDAEAASFDDSDFEEIDERRIVRGSDDLPTN